MNRDFAEMLSELSAAGVEFLVVGAHALAALLRNKRAAGRAKDLADVEALESKV